MTPAKEATFIALWQKGLTTDAIAQRLGTKEGAARSRAYTLQQQGKIQPRPKEGRRERRRPSDLPPRAVAQAPALRLLKERFRYALKAVDGDYTAIPARFDSPALDCGFLLVPIASAHYDSRLIALRNLSLAAKYDRHTTHQVGISIARRNADYMIDWFYASFPWFHDADLDARLRENYPFQPVRESPEPRYQFCTEKLRTDLIPR
jgi:hypothetical protein